MRHVPTNNTGPASALSRLVEVMDTLRVSCPWDARQTHESLAPHLLEEAYEALEALESGDWRALRDELGDVLLQVVFHARIAAERTDGTGFTIDDVANGIVEKLIRRHPHVFGDVTVSGPDEVKRNWDAIKAAERAGADGTPSSAVDSVPFGQPALALAAQLQRRAERAGAPAQLAELAAGSTGNASRGQASGHAAQAGVPAGLAELAASSKGNAPRDLASGDAARRGLRRGPGALAASQAGPGALAASEASPDELRRPGESAGGGSDPPSHGAQARAAGMECPDGLPRSPEALAAAWPGPDELRRPGEAAGGERADDPHGAQAAEAGREGPDGLPRDPGEAAGGVRPDDPQGAQAAEAGREGPDGLPRDPGEAAGGERADDPQGAQAAEVSEIGAELFALVAKARKAGLDPEMELRAAARHYADRVRSWERTQA